MPTPIRCAIYTRKSSEEGLEQSYNSLDAQRDACAAYALSQVGEGWVVLPQAYDDGGYSGGSMERPALLRLLADIRARRVDVVVVYKVDRLTRSLADFARIVEVLDQNNASFVSVTQAFNTTTSMGRLTLNVLLSFAQFEREVTGERIRDKIAASKRLGMWMGGTVPLGYDLPVPGSRALAVNATESEQVRAIFRRYLDLGSMHRLCDVLKAEGIVSKRRIARSGRETGGTPMARGALYHLVRNRLYVGEIRHKGATYPGQHPAIVQRELFDAVQVALDATSAGAEAGTSTPHRATTRGPAAPLRGILYDGNGARMSPVKARKSGGAIYRYYVSQSLLTGRRPTSTDARRVNAVQLERQVDDLLLRLDLLPGNGREPDWPAARALVRRIALDGNRMAITLDLPPKLLPLVNDPTALRTRLGDAEVSISAADDTSITLTTKLIRLRRSGAIAAFGPAGRPAVTTIERDPVLASALIRAEAWKRRILSGETAHLEAIAQEENLTSPYIARMARLAFLDPALKRQILEGKQPAGLTLQRLMTNPIPLAWSEQQALYRA